MCFVASVKRNRASPMMTLLVARQLLQPKLGGPSQGCGCGFGGVERVILDGCQVQAGPSGQGLPQRPQLHPTLQTGGLLQFEEALFSSSGPVSSLQMFLRGLSQFKLRALVSNYLMV